MKKWFFYLLYGTFNITIYYIFLNITIIIYFFIYNFSTYNFLFERLYYFLPLHINICVVFKLFIIIHIINDLKSKKNNIIFFSKNTHYFYLVLIHTYFHHYLSFVFHNFCLLDKEVIFCFCFYIFLMFCYADL